jgi:hypothetical protein
MAQRVLRFSIRDGDRRAATWKLWTEANTGHSDVYLVCRALGGVLKTSLHESGNWHVSFSQRTFRDRVEGVIPSLPTRFVEKWARPGCLAPGVTPAYRIVTPWSAVTTPISEKHPDSLIWLPRAPDGKATEIDIMLVNISTPIDGWPGKRSMNTSLIGSFELANGTTVYAIHWIIPMPVLSRVPSGTGLFFRDSGRDDLKKEGIRALAFGDEPDGSRTIYDFAVKVLPPKDSTR